MRPQLFVLSLLSMLLFVRSDRSRFDIETIFDDPNTSDCTRTINPSTASVCTKKSVFQGYKSCCYVEISIRGRERYGCVQITQHEYDNLSKIKDATVDYYRNVYFDDFNCGAKYLWAGLLAIIMLIF